MYPRLIRSKCTRIDWQQQLIPTRVVLHWQQHEIIVVKFSPMLTVRNRFNF